ncbi:glucan biosynthesis protein [Aurantimonas sp. MSK8Z-1]|uniref:glucan biosynthesis protein n=1 Tax=Mangrovibrevibacter kandeliae TaxID=2968473 RepID=UPI002118C602|nr:glucan biosynthesis protein [Aurantimonas sp. MSK8Z-1]MCW4115003.1 glucan biosynthesis protein [Aurantimonas sp. MSK8Z-1]
MSAINRRDFLYALSALGVVATTGDALAGLPGLTFGDARPYGFDALVERARAMAAQPYDNAPPRAADILEEIDYDAHWKIQYRPRDTLELNGGKAPIRFFHLGRYFKMPVKVHVIDGNTSREVLYSPDLFRMPIDSVARQLPRDIGFAGFRVLDADNTGRDWLAFLGAAYFRTAGELGQYGLSARALAIDVAMPTPEEFPRFTEFFLGPSDTGGQLAITCLLDSPRMTGVFRMDVTKDGPIVMEIESRFFARDDIARVGLAPLTSMYWYSETDRSRRVDWRPEVHDSDGLSIWAATGERIWRPLNDPERVITSSFSGGTPKGFGLLQRDRNFDEYEDDSVYYDRRSGAWIEPKGDWGTGAVQLVEIPTDDEIHDNIVAYWVADKPVKKGDALSLDYTLTWSTNPPHPTDIGLVVATRLGRGGNPGQPRPSGVTKIVVDFDGGLVAGLDREAQDVKAIVTSSRGTVSNVNCYSVKVGTAWRASFDIKVDDTDPVDVRLYMEADGEPVSETWLYQFLPLSDKARGS